MRVQFLLLSIACGCGDAMVVVPPGASPDGGDEASTTMPDGGGSPDAGPKPSPSWVPADRIVPWTGNVGVEGGIPNRTTIRNCVTSDGVPTNPATDATAAIQKCLDNAPQDGVAFLPAGTYQISATVTIPSNKSLRGAGLATTVFTNAKIDNLLYMGAGHSNNGPLFKITSGHTKGSSMLTLSDASSLQPGSYVLINEKNDASIPVTPNSYADGPCSWCDQFGATRLRAQVAKVKSKNGNTIEITPALFYDFSAQNDPIVMKLNAFTERAGIEDLVVKNATGITGSWNVNIMVRGAANSWVKNAKVDTCGKRCIDLRTYYWRIEVRDSLVEGCLDHASSDTCYGTELAEGSSSLVENNAYHDVSQGPMLMWGASGNVVSYNYAESVFRTQQATSWFWPTSWSHGAHPSYNLWEGNEMSAINWDGYWGSASHAFAFRNRLTSKEPAAGLLPGHVEDAALIIETNNHFMSVAGNVLGLDGWTTKYEESATRNWSANLIFGIGTGGGGDPTCFSTLFRHANYDYATKSVKSCGEMGEPPCQGGDGTMVLPASLYLTGKPAWFGAVPFPPIDPVGPAVADIPAKKRFKGN